MSDRENSVSFLKKELGTIPPHSVVLEEYDSDVAEGLQQMRSSIMKDGKLSKKTKELVRIGIASVLRLPSEPFARYHANAAVRAGNTPEEIHEAVEVALLYGGLSSYASYGYAVVREAEKAAAKKPKRR